MRSLIILLQVLFTTALLGGFWIWWQLQHVLSGYPPDGGFLLWWRELGEQLEFYLLEVQVLYPILWWSTSKLPWSPFWRTWRMIHLALVLLLLLATGLAWLQAFKDAVAQAEAEFRDAVGKDVATVVALGLEAYAH
jgi:hypothetical protein